METKKIETWLPIFPGFYGTLFEADEDNEIHDICQQRESLGLNEIGYEQLEFGYDDYRNSVADHATDFIEEKLKELNLITSIRFQAISSPREYNFANDSIHVEIELTEENRKSIMRHLVETAEDFNDYIKESYTSCSGFISHHSNDYIDWIWMEAIEDRHKLGAILQYICINEEITHDDMYDYCTTQGCYISCTNYDDATTKQYDFDEDQFIEK